MPSFEYEPLVLFLELEISDEEENRKDTNGAGPSGTKVVKQLGDLRGGKDNLENKATKQTLEQVKFILQEVNSQEYASTTTKIGEQIQLEEHIIQEDQQDQIELMSKLQEQDQTQITLDL